MEGTKSRKDNKRKKSTLRGDVIRRAERTKKKKSDGPGIPRISYSDFFTQFDAQNRIGESREWLSNKDDVSLYHEALGMTIMALSLSLSLDP